ncbi:DUF2180 family protein [Streptomyces sp. NPDC006923]|uniref:DUF2180 family protein n=1 Tax=Streptomyces sp. NPDC006923 TaxID=3155355 RepID=UPI0033E4F883
MNCFDCHLTHQATAPAVAICRRCGVAVCADHMHVGAEPIQRRAGLGPATQPHNVRRITCATCHAAEAGRHPRSHLRKASTHSGRVHE